MATPNYVHSQGYLELHEGLIDPTNNTKRVDLAFTLVPPSTTITLEFPPASTTIVGTTTTQTLTNKTITGTTNTVSADSLKTTGAAVNVVAAAPPTTNQSLFATAPTTAVWQTPLLTYTFKNGTMTTPGLPALKQWHGFVNTATQTATFNVTTTGLAGGPLVFTDLTNAHFQATARFNATNIVDIPFASIRTVTNATGVVLVNVLAPVGILIGGVSMKANAENSTIYLYVIGT